ncbi:serpin family protein [Gloeothece verrucosa]|uniref:Proteinase inhibitor I4 serpin n=1 Tax=Gloeothece verrucosa (strain PCC 7822) TaxID=497965 RepID=E0UDK5_GLOV7|nr:serpin family protein [Gloeothece verrucosa]ADN15318.1 proteinase inhibitor I4 serpin [Gloeothece verrucosa PCC 7822]
MIKTKGLLSALSDTKIKEKAVFATTSLTLLLFISGWLAQYSSDALEFVANPQATYRFHAFMPSLKQLNPQQQLIEANTQFGLNLFQTLVTEDPNQNVFVSPTSVAIALSMVLQGTDGKTQQQMLSTLGYENLNLKQINMANLTLLKTLQTENSQIEVALANALYAREGVSFRHQFLKDNEQYYHAQITSLNFSSPQAPGIINRWTKEHTNGKIDQIITRIDPSEVLILINAIYFKGIWKTEFAQKQTKEEPFYLPNGQTKQQPLMSGTGKYQYYENEEFQAVNLPYGDGRLSMYVFLPRTNSNLTKFLNQVTAENWTQWTGKFNVQEGSLKIPRFKLEYDTNLKETLSALGMESLFRQANFSQMTSSPVVINEVKHKTFIEVNEKGTEAAGVTSIGVRGTSTAGTFSMTVNRPFFCAIRDNQTGTILFMGAIVDPKQ